jgi:hypothetical protein
MTPRGAMTRTLPAGERQFAVELDFRDAAIRVECDNGAQSALPAAGKTIAEVHRGLVGLLTALGLPAPLHGAPNEIPDPVRFAEDDRPREWNADAAARLHGAFLCADRSFNAFRSLYRGKSSPSHLFWGGFDLAVTRFSGRRAPERPGADAVTRESYSHEVISHGWWAGSGAVNEAAFYAYAAPEPAGLKTAAMRPAATYYSAEMSIFVLPYEAVRTSATPEADLQSFLTSTYETAATLAQWDRPSLERSR